MNSISQNNPNHLFAVAAPLDVFPKEITGMILDYCASSICAKEAANQSANDYWYANLKRKMEVHIQSITREINCSSNAPNPQTYCLEVANKIRKFVENSKNGPFLWLEELKYPYEDLDLLPLIDKIQSIIDTDLCIVFKNVSKFNVQLNHIFGIDCSNKDKADFIRKWISDEKQIKYIKNFVYLSLENLNLQTIPYEIGIFTELKNLNLSSNEIQQIPDSFSQLKKLSILDLNENNFERIPSSLFQLSQLESLSLSYNKIQQIPDCFIKLKHLRNISFDFNCLKEIPDFMSQFSRLSELSLICNELEQLPQNIGKLSTLLKFNIAGNKFNNLPESFQKLIDNGCKFDIPIETINKLMVKKKSACIIS